MTTSLFKRLFAHTAISAFAFFAVGVIALLIVPVIIAAYGLAAYGLAALARALVPTGLLALMDPGLSEQATRAVSQARVDGDWPQAARRVASLLAMGVIAGLLAGIAIASASPWVARAMHADDFAPAFVAMLLATAAAAPVLFPALVLDGVVKGFEDFRRLRSIEVITSIVYALGIVAIVRAGLGVQWVAFVFLASMLLRPLFLLPVARSHWRRAGAPRARPSRAELAAAWTYGRHLAAGRVITTIRDQAPAPVIGALVGPVAVGVYDVLVRLPRFVKTTLALLNSALLPTAARMDHAADDVALRRLATGGTALVTAATVPIACAGALFSAPLLAHWIGPQLVAYSAWQGAMFIVPACNTIAGFGATVLLTRAHVVRRMNAFTLLQTLLLYAGAFATVAWLGERAFIAAIAGATLLVFPFQMRVIARELALPAAALRPVVLVLIATLALAALGAWAGLPARADTLPSLLLLLAVWTGVAAAVAFMLLPRDLRSQLLAVVKSLFRR